MLANKSSILLLVACLAGVRAKPPRPAPPRTNPNVVQCGSELGQTARCNALVSDGEFHNFQSHRNPLILFERDAPSALAPIEDRDTIGDVKWFSNGGGRDWVRDVTEDTTEDDEGQLEEDDTGDSKWFRKHAHAWKREDGDDDATPTGADDTGDGKWFHRGPKGWKRDGEDVTGDEKWFTGASGSRGWRRNDESSEEVQDDDVYSGDDQGDMKWFNGGRGGRAWKRVEWTDSSDNDM